MSNKSIVSQTRTGLIGKRGASGAVGSRTNSDRRLLQLLSGSGAQDKDHQHHGDRDADTLASANDYGRRDHVAGSTIAMGTTQHHIVYENTYRLEPMVSV
jgi:hypothetical protein